MLKSIEAYYSPLLIFIFLLLKVLLSDIQESFRPPRTLKKNLINIYYNKTNNLSLCLNKNKNRINTIKVTTKNNILHPPFMIYCIIFSSNVIYSIILYFVTLFLYFFKTNYFFHFCITIYEINILCNKKRWYKCQITINM